MLNKSVVEMEKAKSIDPKNSSFRSVGVTYLNLGEYENAISALEDQEESAYTLSWTGMTLFRQGKKEQAADYFDRITEMDTERLWSLVARIFSAYLENNINEGLTAMNELEQANVADAEAWYYWSANYAMLGDKEGSVRCLQRAVDGGYFNYPLLKSDFFFDSIRSDPEFRAVVQQMKGKHLAFKERFF